MSAADRLRALDAPYDGAAHIRADEKVARGLALLDALPALVAVVEAAEELKLWEPGRKGYAAAQGRVFAALHDLDRALGGGE